MAPAGLWTTPSDLARYAIEVQKSLAGSSNRVLWAMVRQMLTAVKGRQGLGPGVGGGDKQPYFTHGGANEGYRCELMAYNSGDGVVIMTNGDNGGQLASEIERSVAREYGWPDFQPKERTVTAVDPKVLDTYAGVYQSDAGAFTVTREGQQLFVQLAGQPKFPAFANGDGRFFLKVVDAQFTFIVDSEGRATARSTRMERTLAKRVDDAAAKRMTDEAAARAELVAKRFKEQSRRREVKRLRRMIEELGTGQPDYSKMTPKFADVTRQQLPDLKAAVTQMGALQSLTFKGVGPGGFDIYEVKFEKASAEFRIGLTPDGKVEGVGFRPL